jgi:hypothetical protein
MPPAPELTHELRRATRALRRHGAAVGLGWGVVAALGGVLLVAVAARLMPLWYQATLVQALVWALAGGPLLGALLGYLWPRPLPRRLRHLDRRLCLADRLTTAWELAQDRLRAPAAIATLQRRDTLQALRRADLAQAFPLRPSRVALRLAAALALLLLPLLLLENPQEAELARRQAAQAATEAAITQLTQTREALAQNPALSEEQRQAAIQALNEALATLQNPASTPAERQAALTQAERELAALRSSEAEAQAQRLAEAAPLGAEPTAPEATDVVRPLREALQRGDVEAAAEYLRSLTDPNEQRLSAEEMVALADAFQEMADNLQATDPELAEQLQQIAQEIYTGDYAGATEALNEAADTLSEVAEAQAPNEALSEAQGGLQQAQEQLGAGGEGMADAPQDGAQGGGTQSQPGSSAEEATGSGGTGHSEDAGSAPPYGEDIAPRIGETGGEITLPRTGDGPAGPPQHSIGRPDGARVPFQEVYGTYREAAEAELSHNAYPPSLRTYVRTYFDGLGGE